MKKMKRDILAENPQLRKQAHTAPEGYFEEFKSQMKRLLKITLTQQ